MRLFLSLEPTVARTFQLLKGLGVEPVQQRTDRLVQSPHTEKTLVPQRRQNLSLRNLYAGLDFGFVLWPSGPCREDHGAEMFGHFLVNPLEHRFVATGTDDRSLGIIGHGDPGHPA